MSAARLMLPRTLRLDASDGFMFDPAAAPGQWAVSGAFLWTGVDLDALPRKARAACRAGFLGVEDWGFSTLAVVAPATAQERADLEDRLADQFVARLGAPDRAAALPAAREEVAFAASFCAGQPEGMLLAVHRTPDADGALRESFRTLRPRDPGEDPHGRAFLLVETDEDDAPAETVDLLALGGTP